MDEFFPKQDIKVIVPEAARIYLGRSTVEYPNDEPDGPETLLRGLEIEDAVASALSLHGETDVVTNRPRPQSIWPEAEEALRERFPEWERRQQARKRHADRLLAQRLQIV